jgi:hypothetical protein
MAPRAPSILNAENPRDTLSAGAMRGRPSSWTIQVTAIAGAGTMRIRGNLPGSGVADTAAPVIGYDDWKAQASVNGDTPISAVGLYRVVSDNLNITLELASGTSVTYLALPVEEER